MASLVTGYAVSVVLSHIPREVMNGLRSSHGVSGNHYHVMYILNPGPRGTLELRVLQKWVGRVGEGGGVSTNLR